MRIVSLLPSATEWICAMGKREALVGRSHECDFPPSVSDVPVVTRPTYETDGDSATIDDAVQQQLQAGLTLFDIDLEQLQALDPDLVVTQDQCDVCAVSRGELGRLLDDWTGSTPEVVSMQPQTLKDVLDQALRLGRTMGCLDAGMDVIGTLEADLKRVREQIGIDRRTDPDSLPSVACVEWLEPLMIAGHWMPDVVEMAGGDTALGTSGEPSRRIAWDDLRAADPDVICVIPCGFTIEETWRDLSYLRDRAGWDELSAVREGRVALLDGQAYFNRPGPRLYRAIELLADTLHPTRVSLEPPVEAWERQWADRGLPTPA